MRYKNYIRLSTNIEHGTTELQTCTFNESHHREAQSAVPQFWQYNSDRTLPGIEEDKAFALMNTWNTQAVRNVTHRRTKILFTYFV